MRLHIEACKWYVLKITVNPPMPDGTVYQASFDGGVTWKDGTDGVVGKDGVTGWGWLLAGARFPEDQWDLTPTPSAFLSVTTEPLIRVKETPDVLEIEEALLVTVWGNAA